MCVRVCVCVCVYVWPGQTAQYHAGNDPDGSQARPYRFVSIAFASSSVPPTYLQLMGYVGVWMKVTTTDARLLIASTPVLLVAETYVPRTKTKGKEAIATPVTETNAARVLGLALPSSSTTCCCSPSRSLFARSQKPHPGFVYSTTSCSPMVSRTAALSCSTACVGWEVVVVRRWKAG